MRNKTYLCFRADTVTTVDPDVLGHAITFLVEIHVLHELDWISAMEWQIKGARRLTFSVLEIVVDSACSKC